MTVSITCSRPSRKKKYKEEKKAEKKPPPNQTQYHLSYIQVLPLEIVWSLQQTHSLLGFIIGVLQYGSRFLQLLPVTMTWEIWTYCIQQLIAKHIAWKQLKSPHEPFPEIKLSPAISSSETSEIKY